MSDVAPGTLSLEEHQAPPPPPDTPPPADPPPADPPPPPPNPEDADPDGTIEATGGVKFVPLSALAAARQAAREAKAEVAALKPKADLADQVAREWQAAQPILERAKQITSQPPPPKETPKGPLSDQEAVEYAKDLDLYRADGTPDTDRAQRLAARQDALADRRAQQYVAPLAEQNAVGQSRANFEQAANFKQPQTGLQVDRAILEQVWSTVPPHLSAQPNVAMVLWQTALGQMVIQGKLKPGAAPPPPPVITEGLGGGGGGRAELSAVERGLSAAAGMTTKEFQETSARFKPGERNSLE